MTSYSEHLSVFCFICFLPSSFGDGHITYGQVTFLIQFQVVVNVTVFVMMLVETMGKLCVQREGTTLVHPRELDIRDFKIAHLNELFRTGKGTPGNLMR